MHITQKQQVIYQYGTILKLPYNFMTSLDLSENKDISSGSIALIE